MTLMDRAGAWSGTNELKDPMTGVPETTPSALTVARVMHDKFVRVGYTWSYGGKAQEGLIMIAHDPKDGSCQFYWGDTFHMGWKIMTLHGNVDGDTLSALGSYPAGEGPDWGWRITIEHTSESIRITMYNIEPGAEEELFVTADYKPESKA